MEDDTENNGLYEARRSGAGVGAGAEDSETAAREASIVAGITASVRTLVISSFRTPPTKFMLNLLRQLNPTASILRAGPFVAYHHKLFALLCLLNINMNALDLTRHGGGQKASRRGGGGGGGGGDGGGEGGEGEDGEDDDEEGMGMDHE